MAGDQLPTDGILADRLRFTFLHYAAQLTGVPPGPELMHRWGELVRRCCSGAPPPTSGRGYLEKLQVKGLTASHGGRVLDHLRQWQQRPACVLG